MNLEIRIDEMAKDIARRAMDEATYEGKTMREWINLVKAYTEKETLTIDTVPVVHARWVSDGYRGISCVCSHCGEEAHYTSTFRQQFDYDWEENLVPCGYEEIREYIRSNCCPNCGARMDGEE